MKFLIKSALYLYKIFFSFSIKLLFGGGCRYEPTCSEYACKAIEKHGILRGSFLSIKRLIRCNPFGSYGLDPVPDR